MEHPDYLLARLSSRQLGEWMAYFQEHPFGQDFSDRQMAQVACILANVHRKPNSTAHKLDEFLPNLKVEQKTPQQMMTTLRSVLSGYRQKH